jgi:GR25 family glycosyltransferase involved in LPS biosynthesis
MYVVILILLLFIIILYNNKYKNIYDEETFLIYSNDAYVINLDSRPDRMEKLIPRFPSLNIHRVSAVKHTHGLTGCGLSHMKAVKMAKEMDLPSILNMEDDCVPTDAFVHWPKIQTWLENHKDQWDIFLGGTTYYNKRDNNDVSPICNLGPIKIYKTSALTTHFIYINSNAYDDFLEWEENKDIAIDLWPNMKKMKIVSCVPFIAIQDKSFSDIQKKEENYDEMFKVSENTIGLIENIKECFSTLGLQ